jgi:hypothetical protein
MVSTVPASVDAMTRMRSNTAQTAYKAMTWAGSSDAKPWRVALLAAHMPKIPLLVFSARIL